jgi:hypothetical protein
MRKTYYDCLYFKKCGNVFGGCKHPRATSACFYEYTEECKKGKSRKQVKMFKPMAKQTSILEV